MKSIKSFSILFLILGLCLLVMGAEQRPLKYVSGELRQFAGADEIYAKGLRGAIADYLLDDSAVADNYVLSYDEASKKLIFVEAGAGASPWTDADPVLVPTDTRGVRTKDDFQLIDSTNRIDKSGTAFAIIAANQFLISIGAADRFYVDENGNIGLATDVFGTSATNVFGIKAGTAPEDSPDDICQLHVVDEVIEIDYMEYANDGAAQAAYVSNGGEFVVEANEDAVAGNWEIKDLHPSNVENYSSAFGQAFTAPMTFTLTKAKFYLKKVASPTGTDACMQLYASTGTVGTDAKPTGNALASSPAFNVSTLTTSSQLITFDFSGDPYELQEGTDYCIVFVSPTAGAIDGTNKVAIGVSSPPYHSGNYCHYDNGAWIGASASYDTCFYVYGGVSLQCYSESTIKTQGSYSLEAIAQATDSLNVTLTRTVDPVINLTGRKIIKLDVRGDATGEYFKIGFHDSGGTTTEHTIDIASAGDFQTDEIDISGVSDVNKDAIDSIIVTIVNAGAIYTFYIDNMYGDALAELYGMDEAENDTKLTSHDLKKIPKEKVDEYYYPSTYESQSKVIGRRIVIDREGLARAIEELTGKKFIYEEEIEIKDMTEEKLRKLPQWIQDKRAEEIAKRKEKEK